MKYFVKKALIFAVVFTLFTTALSSSVAAQASAMQEPISSDSQFCLQYDGREIRIAQPLGMTLEAITHTAALMSIGKTGDPRIAVCCSPDTMQLATRPYEAHSTLVAGSSCTISVGNMVFCTYCGYVHSATRPIVSHQHIH